MPACRHNLKRAKPGSIPCSYPFSLDIPLTTDHLLLPSGMIPICSGNLVPTASMVLANMCISASFHSVVSDLYSVSPGLLRHQLLQALRLFSQPLRVPGGTVEYGCGLEWLGTAVICKSLALCQSGINRCGKA